MNPHPWKARLIVCLIMLVLAFIGIIISDVISQGGWIYWKWVSPVYAFLALWLSWYTKKIKQTISPITIWHELLHWIGLILSVFLVSHLVKIGIASNFLAGIIDLLLLGLAVFIAGAYIEPIFLLIGAILGIFALFTALVTQYIYAITIPIIISAALIIILYLSISRRKTIQK